MNGDKYYIKGQAGAVGPQSNVHDINFNQIWDQISQDTDLSKLAEDLSKLSSALKEEAKDPEHYRAIAEISEAETASKSGDGPKALEHLKKSGKWAFDMVSNIGAAVAATTLQKILGM